MSKRETRDSGAAIVAFVSGKSDMEGCAGTTGAKNLKFQVCWHRPGARWIVRCDSQVCGDYLTRKQALLGANGFASDAQQAGYDAQVWDEAVRVF
jgi:hypothetical protein